MECHAVTGGEPHNNCDGQLTLSYEPVLVSIK